MRANGIPERLITGDASDWEKFEAWAETVPETLRNPLYHWTAMELKRPFGIDDPAGAGHRPRDLRPLQREAGASPGSRPWASSSSSRWPWSAPPTIPPTPWLPTRHSPRGPTPSPGSTRPGVPTRRSRSTTPRLSTAWVDALERSANSAVSTFDSFLQALESRHAVFHAHGCRASDHGLETIVAEPYTDADVRATFDQVRRGQALEPADARRLKSALLHRLALLDHQRGWVQQFHLGALRNNNTPPAGKRLGRGHRARLDRRLRAGPVA